MIDEKLPEDRYIERLVNEYRYPKLDIQREVAYSFGRARFRFDVIVMKEGKPYILVEVKTGPKITQMATDQLLKYVKAIDVQFAVLTDGVTDKCYKVKRDAYETDLLSIPDIPPYGKTLEVIGKHSNEELIKVGSNQINRILFYVFDKTRSTLNIRTAFNEILKLLVLKVYDEKRETGMFRASLNEPPENVNSRIMVLLTKAQNEYPNLLKDQIHLDNYLLREIVYEFQKYQLKDSLQEVVGSKLPFEKVLGTDAFEYTTPRTLVKMAMDLLSPEEGSSFIDPACGVGSLLTEAASRGLKVTGIEINTEIAKYSEANLALSGFEGQIINADSLKIMESPPPNLSYSKFDYAAVIPPFGQKIDDPRLNQFITSSNKRSQNTEVLFIEHTIRFLRRNGKMVIVIPQGILFGDSYYEARQYLLKTCKIKAIVNLPTNMFVPLTSIRTTLLLVEKMPEEGTLPKDRVFVASCDNAAEFDKLVSSYRKFEKDGTLAEDFAFIAHIDNAKQINPDYLKGMQDLKDKSAKGELPSWPQVPLQNIASIVTGVRMETIGKKSDLGSSLYVRAGEVNDLLIDADTCIRVNAERNVQNYTAQRGDLLMTRAGTVGRVALVQDDTVPLVLGSNVLKISITNKSQILPKFLLAVLRSDYGQKQIDMFTGGSTIRTISVSGLRQIKIPVPPIEEQERVAQQMTQIIETKSEANKISKKFKLKEQELLEKLNNAIGR
jgi:type I restriction enzyme M protein